MICNPRRGLPSRGCCKWWTRGWDSLVPSTVWWLIIFLPRLLFLRNNLSLNGGAKMLSHPRVRHHRMRQHFPRRANFGYRSVSSGRKYLCTDLYKFIYLRLFINFHIHSRDFVIFVVRHFGTSLQYGNQFIYQSLPRLLSLWLDYGTGVVEMEKREKSQNVRQGKVQGMRNVLVKTQ